MRTKKILEIEGTIIEKEQLKRHLEKIAINHNLVNKSQKQTYPIPKMIENYKKIEKVYELLNEHLKLGINIHPAGEWLLDNFYIIEETVKQIQKELTIKKYKNFVGIANGKYKGFARIYLLAAEIVAYTDNKIEKKDLEDYLKRYQTKKLLSMEEIWNIGIFLQIVIIDNIREICEKIYVSQIQKMKAENIVKKIIENKNKKIFKINNLKIKIINKKNNKNIKNTFIEHMSYILKKKGKQGYKYYKALEEIVEIMGTNISEIIKKEHFDIAVKKVSMGNSITSIRKIKKINFLNIFEKINGVEEILKKDPYKIFEKMDNKTKEYYRTKIKEISKKTKISEIYIAKKALELSRRETKSNKKNHIGYYLIDEGINELYKILNYKNYWRINNNQKIVLYLLSIITISILLSVAMSSLIKINLINIIVFLIPSSEIVIQLFHYISSKLVKPKIIPKIDYSKGIDEEHKTMVVIPTIIKTKDKVKEMMKKLEIFYLANKSENIYFTLLGDCSESKKEEEKFDIEIIKEGEKITNLLNEKYPNKNGNIKKFNFIYRKRIFNEKENSYLGWERKRGFLTQLNNYLLGKINNPFIFNTIEKNKKNNLEKIKYIITLDADTDLILNSAFELIGSMAHVLNTPVIDKEKNIVVKGYGIMQPRIGIDLEISYKTLFTKIFAGMGGIDSYTNAISDFYQDNFGEGIFTGKGIYDLEIYSKILENQIPENTVLSHDLLEGCYLRCGLVSDVLLIDRLSN